MPSYRPGHHYLAVSSLAAFQLIDDGLDAVLDFFAITWRKGAVEKQLLGSA